MGVGAVHGRAPGRGCLQAAAGLDPDHYSGHSLRAGFATSAALAGATEIAIARQTRHRSMTALRGYIREADLFKLNAATTVGL